MPDLTPLHLLFRDTVGKARALTGILRHQAHKEACLGQFSRTDNIKRSFDGPTDVTVPLACGTVRLLKER